MTNIGSDLPRADGWDKVAGKSQYTVDYSESGMLHGCVLRSPVVCGRIVRVDVEAARSMPGVRAVVTATNVGNGRAGMLVRDQTLFADREIRHHGEAIAAVAADTLAQARAARDAIELEAESLPALTTMAQALASDAPLVHPDWESYALNPMAAELRRQGNVAGELIADPDGVDEAFERAHLVVEDEFCVDRQYQAYLEPMSAVARFTDGRCIVRTGSQFPYNIREELAAYLDVRLSDVRVIGQTVGGGFGAKLGCGTEGYAAVLSRAVGGRSVRVVKTRDEDIVTAPVRENAELRIRTALDAEGNMTAREFSCDMDCGAYGLETPTFPSILFHFAAGIYRIGPVRVHARAVYTNTPPTGAFRGVNGPAVYFAVERHMDNIARRLNEDPMAFRARHMLRDGDTLLNGQALADAHIAREACEAVQKSLPAVGARQSGDRLRGVGSATGFWVTNPLPGSVTITVGEDGRLHVLTGANDNGSGAVAMGLTQIVAEAMGVSTGEVIVGLPDTDLSGYDSGSQGSRTTHIVGKAALIAIDDLKTRIFDVARQMLPPGANELELVGGMVRAVGIGDAQVPLAAVFQMANFSNVSLSGSGTYATTPPAFTPGCAVGLTMPSLLTPTYHAHRAEVEVDSVTGNVRLLRYVVAQEVGRAINPDGIMGQIQGGIAQGIGFTLTENLRLVDGRYLERSLEAYRLPLAQDLPRVEVVLLEHPDSEGPFGAKGVAEPPLVFAPAAIANAVSDAVGKPFYKLPITPEDVLFALDT
ncbi:MAG: xanthine dehydrogenase family protein molybdopterin-binding subunit [Kiritimatiellia bacterium]|jgi:CO/xanthine dehydrogenase Mo-binding subunit|nr:xanthine dehydrogenase family protein molybdopterin-binding subunit [Pseudomonadales bacterium]MDP7024040.1 xanthine dehydrogenase family protein molybdopterin-binding subunit [Kiritimatiellia bacterium]